MKESYHATETEAKYKLEPLPADDKGPIYIAREFGL
jgi:hypothetical protein